jgi:tripartite ATP-independent transporter DctP family solute receptor
MLCRRHLLLTGALAAPAILAPRRASRAASRTLRISYILPRNSQLGAAANAFADELARRTDGRLAIAQFPDAALGGDVEAAKGVQLGSIDLAIITGIGLTTTVPSAAVFDIPFLFKDVQHAHTVLDGPIGESFREQFAAKDMVMLAWGENGLRHMTNARHPIVVPQDVKGLRMRVPQSDVMIKAFQALGVDVAALPFPQLFEALRAGTFDGQENPIATIQASKFDQVQKFLTLTGHVYDPAVLVMAPDAFDDLTADDKAHMLASAKIGADASRRAAAAAEANGVAALQQAGMTVQREIDRTLFIEAMASANTWFEDKFGRDLVKRIRQTE